MSFLDLFRRRGSAPVARERLQILLSYERATRGQSDLLAILREEILSAITSHERAAELIRGALAIELGLPTTARSSV